MFFSGFLNQIPLTNYRATEITDLTEGVISGALLTRRRNPITDKTLFSLCPLISLWFTINHLSKPQTTKYNHRPH